MWEYAGVVCSIWAYDAGDVEDIEGVAVVCRTRFTSFKASSDHRSTLRTYMVCSISLFVGTRCTWSATVQASAQSSVEADYSLAVDLLAGLCVLDYEPHTGRRGDGSAVLSGCQRPWLAGREPPVKSRKTSVPCRQTHTCAHVVAVAQHQGCRSSG